MVEEAQVSERHAHLVLIASSNHFVVSNTASGLCHILYPNLRGVVNRVPEGEKGIA